MKTLSVKDPSEFKCPFGGGNVVVGTKPESVVIHSIPFCKEYGEKDALGFLRSARIKVESN